MSRLKLEVLKTIFTSQYWLIASLCGAFFSFFALNRGGVVVFIEAGFIFLIINLVSGKYLLKDIPASYWVTVAICGYLLGASVLFYPKTSHYRWMAHLVRMLCVVFVIHCLSLKNLNTWVSKLLFAILSASVCWQAGAYYIYGMPFGSFTNMHHLSSFSILTIPAIAYCFMVTKGWYKFLFLPVALLDIDLLLKIGSRPAILGIAVGAIFILIVLTRGWRKWGGLLLLCVIFVSLYITDYGNVYSRFEELVVNFLQEERFALGRSAWNMIKDNSLTAWIFGNGIGGARSVLPQYSTGVLKALIFSHNYLLEIFYESGIIGVISVFGGIAWLLIYAIKAAKQTDNKNIRIFISCMVVAFISWLIHTGLTFPFYSKYSQYSLGFILGVLLAVIGHPANRIVKPTRSQDMFQRDPNLIPDR